MLRHNGRSQKQGVSGNEEERWEAVRARRPEADGTFVYGVRTTGVYCRPACRSRVPRRENITFFETAGAAELAGYRACRRCRPQTSKGDKRTALALAACRQIEAAAEPPMLRDLAAAAGLSPPHFQRVFHAVVGVTPRAYAAEVRARRLRDGLARGTRVTPAMYRAGYHASSRMYAEAGDVLGMRPSSYRRGGRGEVIRVAGARTTLGRVLVAATQRGVCAIELGTNQAALVARLRRRFPAAVFERADRDLSAWVQQVVAAVETPGGRTTLPLDVQGTAFQRRVWHALRGIPAGQTRTYGQVAAALGRPRAARAVARACATNPVAVVVPCHRVVRAGDDPGGYRWGQRRKRALLAREAATKAPV